MAQSTVGRRLASLEAPLGVGLLNRTPEGYVPTLAGDDVRRKAESLEAKMQALQRSIGGRDTCIAGLVRVSCAEAIATYILAPCFAGFSIQHPDVLIELVPDPLDVSLAMRQADLSVRLSQPTQHDTIIKRVGTLAFGLYASPVYLERFGMPDFDAGCAGHVTINQLEGFQDASQTGWLTDLALRARISMQTTSHEAAINAALHGGGLACLARLRADHQPGLVCIDVPTPFPSAGIWLAVHRDIQHTPRNRAVMDWVASCLSDRCEERAPISAH